MNIFKRILRFLELDSTMYISNRDYNKDIKILKNAHKNLMSVSPFEVYKILRPCDEIFLRYQSLSKERKKNNFSKYNNVLNIYSEISAMFDARIKDYENEVVFLEIYDKKYTHDSVKYISSLAYDVIDILDRALDNEMEYIRENMNIDINTACDILVKLETLSKACKERIDIKEDK